MQVIIWGRNHRLDYRGGFFMEIIFKKAEINDIEDLIKLHEASFAGDTEAFGEEAWNGWFQAGFRGSGV